MCEESACAESPDTDSLVFDRFRSGAIRFCPPCAKIFLRFFAAAILTSQVAGNAASCVPRLPRARLFLKARHSTCSYFSGSNAIARRRRTDRRADDACGARLRSVGSKRAARDVVNAPARTRFVKRSRCFLHSVVIEVECRSIRDCTFSIAPSLNWRAQWRNVGRRRPRPRRPRRRRSAKPRSGNRRNVFGHVIQAGGVARCDLFVRGFAGLM